MDNVKYRLKVEALSDFLNFLFDTNAAVNKIDWGDGTVETYSYSGTRSHTYASPGEYIIECDDPGFKANNFNETSKHIKEMEILDGITSIPYSAFEGCSNLTSLIISDSVTTISARAFRSCKALTTLTIPDSVTNIGNNAFYFCDVLASLVIPDSVTSIGEKAFYECNALTSLTLGNGLESIGDFAFYGCKVLATLSIPDSVTSIGEQAFYNCNALTSLILGDGLKTIGGQAFYSCNVLTSLNIPDSVTSIGTSSFSGCIALTSLTIGDGLESIRTNAFYNCKVLATLSIPDSVTSIGEKAFYECNALTSLILGDGLKTIGGQAFYSCKVLTSLNIPDSVTSIGEKAFYECNALRTLTIGDGVTSIGQRAFRNCNKLTSLTLGNGLESIDVEAFDQCTLLTSLVVPNSVTTISNMAFDNCRNLASLTLGNGLESIGSSAFYNGGFTELTYTGSRAEWNALLPNIQDTKVKSVTVHVQPPRIHYDTNGGSSIPDYEGDNYPNPLPTPTKAGYKFVGWFEESTLTTPVVAGGPITESHTIYSKWQEAEYEVYQKTDSGIVKLKIKGDKIVPNSADPTTAKLTKLAINDTNFSIAGGGASVYADYSAMVTSINAMGAEALELGWNIYIRTVEVPDLWISKNDEATSVPYTYTTDAQFIQDLNTAAASGLQIGYFRVNKLETEKVFIPVEDVTLNGSSIVSGGVANIPLAGNNRGLGMTKYMTTEAGGLSVGSDGRVTIAMATNAQIDAKSNQFQPIVPANLQFAVDTAVKGSTDYQSFSCEMADGTTKTLKLYSELT